MCKKQMDKWLARRCHGFNGKRHHVHEEGLWALEHTNNISFYHLNGKTKIKNVGPPSDLIDEKDAILLLGFLVCMNVD